MFKRAREWLLMWGVFWLSSPSIAPTVGRYLNMGYRARPIVRYSRFWRCWVYRGAKLDRGHR